MIRQLLPGVDSAMMNTQIIMSGVRSGVEGLFAIPRWDKIAPTYNEAVEKVLELISKICVGKFKNYRGNLGPDRLHQHERTVAMLKKLGDQQKGYDILIFPAQFGIRHRGRSVRRAREVFNKNEFGLGAFEVGIMLLTHPERLHHYDDLWIDCAGDEYDVPGDDDRFTRAPLFVFSDLVEFGAGWIYGANKHFGSASGFIP